MISNWKGMANMIRMCVFDFPSRKMPVAPLNALVQPMPYLIQLPNCKKRKECVGRKDSWPMTCRRFNAALNSCPSSVMCHLEKNFFWKEEGSIKINICKILLMFIVLATQWTFSIVEVLFPNDMIVGQTIRQRKICTFVDDISRYARPGAEE